MKTLLTFKEQNIDQKNSTMYNQRKKRKGNNGKVNYKSNQIKFQYIKSENQVILMELQREKLHKRLNKFSLAEASPKQRKQLQKKEETKWYEEWTSDYPGI